MMFAYFEILNEPLKLKMLTTTTKIRVLDPPDPQKDRVCNSGLGRHEQLLQEHLHLQSDEQLRREQKSVAFAKRLDIVYHVAQDWNFLVIK